MTRRARPPGALAAVGRTIAVIVVVAGLAACGGGGDEQQTEAGPDTPAATETSGGNGEATDETNETNGGDETNENGPDETTTDDADDGGCPADGSGNCTFLIRCPEAAYEYEIPGTAAESATIVGATPPVTADPETPTRSVDDVVDVTVEVEAELVKLTTLCADGITLAEATQPLEATGG